MRSPLRDTPATDVCLTQTRSRELQTRAATAAECTRIGLNGLKRSDLFCAVCYMAYTAFRIGGKDITQNGLFSKM